MAPNAVALSESELNNALASLGGWRRENGELVRTFEFNNFSEALGWMVRVGLEAEKLDHHPDWSNSWNKVEVHLKTHSIEALSQLDVELATRMNQLAA
ncbi:MAG TPA: 4a-hydroxytetrahydrobiopterin dehydratase [Candidatus Binatia bacterium]|nr:4a-hydroxytetrahydrobiopterin dehydratase [Candidatus Binatia bacterium]